MLSLQQISKGTALALAVGAFAAPVASAGLIGGYSRQDKQLSPNTPVTTGLRGAPTLRPMISPRPVLPAWASSGATAYQAVSSHGSPAVTATGPGDGFNWADAGIGAAGCIAIVAIGGGLVLVERRPRQTKTTAVATG